MIKYKDFDDGESLTRRGMIMGMARIVSIHP